MSRRIPSVIFIVALIAITSSLFYFYVDMNRGVQQIPLKYDVLEKEYIAEEDRVIAINKEIYSKIIREYEELGGDTSILAWPDKRKFLLGGGSDNELLNSIEHEPLVTNQIPKPPSGQDRINTEYTDELKLQSDFKFVSVVHAYATLMALAVYIVMMLLSKKKTITKDS